MRFDTEARIAVAQATDLARELGHPQVGPDHLLLGLLANLRGPASAALADHGLRLDAARELVLARHVDAPADPDTDDGPARLDEDREALRAIGIDLDRVREAVRENLGADLTDGWGSRPARDRRGGRGRARDDRRGDRREERRSHRHHDGDHGRGRRGPRSSRSDGLGFSPELRHLLRDVRRSTLRARTDEDGSAGMTGLVLLRALLHSESPAVRAVLETATDLDGLRARVGDVQVGAADSPR